MGLSDVKGVYIEKMKCMNIREWLYFLAILGRIRGFLDCGEGVVLGKCLV